jgi:hypothetical protein
MIEYGKIHNELQPLGESDLRDFWNAAVAGRSNEQLAKAEIWIDAGPEPWLITIEIPTAEHPDINVVIALVVDGEWTPRPGLDLGKLDRDLMAVHAILSDRVTDLIRNKPIDRESLTLRLARARDRISELALRVAEADPHNADTKAWQPIPENVAISCFWFPVKARRIH